MRLTSITYKDTNWELENLQLQDVNLIVGKNSTGKSRTLSTIDLLYKMITQKRDLNWGGTWDVWFKNYKEQVSNYQFATSHVKKGVTFEKMLLDGKVVLQRHIGEEASIKSYLTGQVNRIYPPIDKLVLHVRRDIKEYPFLESISSWAEQSFGFKFGNLSPYSYFNQQEYDLLTAVEDIPALYKALEKNNRENIINEFNEIGYEIEDISIQTKGDDFILYLKEKAIEKRLPHYKLSQGMFRALSVIIYLEYLITRKKPATVVIDDLCEGLDYERATKLGILIFEKCKNSNIQLIATSNDSFLMDVIDIKYWNILVRRGKKVSAINIHSHPEIFEDFKFTGLSNFDFFSSDFVKQNIS